MRRCKKCQPMTFSWVKGTWFHLLCSTQLSYHFPKPFLGIITPRSSSSWQVDLCETNTKWPLGSSRSGRTREEKKWGHSSGYCSDARMRHQIRTHCSWWHLNHKWTLLTALHLYFPVMQPSWVRPPAESKTLPKTADIHLARSKW